MLRANRFLATLAFFLSPDNGGAGGGAPASKPSGTLEEQLTAARNDLTARDATISTLTTERDTARNDLATRDQTISTLTTERDTARSERDTARNDLTARDATISTLTGERDTARNESSTRGTRITQLESALGAAGVGVNNLPKVPPNTPASTKSGSREDDLLEQFKNETNAEKKSAIFSEIQKLRDKKG